MSNAVLDTTVRPSATRLRLTPRGRALALLLVAAPLVVGSFFGILNGGGATATDTSAAAPLETVTVSSGQSLWQIAERLAPRADTREVIADLMNLNQLPSAEIWPGQLLEVPAEYSR